MGKCIKCGKATRKEAFRYCDDCFQPSQGRTKSDRKRSLSSLPEGYLSRGYFDENGNLWPELITTHAQSVAQSLESAKMTTAALRRFFGKVRFAQRKLDRRDDFSALVPEILALKPYVANATTRGVVPSLFKQFIDQNVDLAIVDAESFLKGFVKHFEYVVAFFPRK